MLLDQMVVTAKHAPGFKTSRRVKRFEDTDENILALHSLVRCIFKITHRW
jgi:hypothetical protein